MAEEGVDEIVLDVVVAIGETLGRTYLVAKPLPRILHNNVAKLLDFDQRGAESKPQEQLSKPV